MDQSSVPILVCEHKFQQLESCVRKRRIEGYWEEQKNVVVDNKFISMNYMYSTNIHYMSTMFNITTN